MTNTHRNFDVVNAVVAAGVWLVALVVYSLTKAPTLSLWDCGEFIASNYILGVPHPPGTPLYVMLGRVFTLLPFSDDVAVRSNMLSVIPSSLTAVFGYLSAVRILRACFGPGSSFFERVLIYAGAASGALFLAFSLTNWNNSVETEVYGLSMMMLMAVFWLGLIYRDNIGTPFGQRVLVLMFFVAFAGIGVHMTTYLVIPAVACLFILKKDIPSRVWYIVGTFVVFELYLVFALSSRPGEIPYYVPVLIVFVFYLFYIFSFEKIPSLYLMVGVGFLLSILPLAGLGIKALSIGADAANVTDRMRFLNIIGALALAALTIVALYFLSHYVLRRGVPAKRGQYLMASLFVLAAGIMTLVLLLDIKGYQAFLMITAVAGLALVVGLRRFFDWPILVATVCVSMTILGVMEMFYGVIIALIIIPLVGLIFKSPSWKTALAIVLVSVIGYSTHVYIPLRSARQPVINENNPSENLTATINYIERKQYGSQSMTSRMFKRRGEWGNQFGDFRRMGFWNFFQEQYGLSGPRFVPFFILGLYGLWEVVRRRSQSGVPMLLLILFASVGLVLYMNFADGTRQHPVTGMDYIEVRDRDYFFTPAFILFGLAIGIGLTGVVHFVKDSLSPLTSMFKKGIVAVLLVLFLLPSYTVGRNYELADRTGNYIAFDYAWNILVSAETNAVLVTAGDNDTFPLWCLQEAYGIRKDVDVVNLSLANARWYIKQLKSTLGIDLRWSDRDIDSLKVFRDQHGNVHRLQDQVVSEIVATNFGRRPVNFSITVPPSGRRFHGQSIDSMLTLRGMAWHLGASKGVATVDIEASIDLLTNPDKMRFRSIADPSVYKSETALRLTRNYLTSFMMVADTLMSAGEFDRTEWLIKKGIEFIPYSSNGINYLAALYAEQAKRDELRQLAESPYADKAWLRTLMGRLEVRQGEMEQAARILSEVMADFPNYRPPFEDLLRVYYESRQIMKLRQTLATWLVHNPDDHEVEQLLKNVDSQLNRPDTVDKSNL
ncbi:MAG: DUF2723 domain-containing protein [Candidatus Zixiibacteriota bacterium]|nr:MAG: DUF2723 domain-containing protein [candidate division Zixibacteria bacterium]